MTLVLLDAVNACLRGIGEAPVSCVEEGDPEVDTSLSIIKQASSQIQATGWWFNRELNWQLTPDVNGEIYIPQGCLSIIAEGENRVNTLTIRGRKVYDMVNHTYDLSCLIDGTGYITLSFIVNLDFDILPPIAQHAVMYMARRMYAQDIEGDVNKWKFTSTEEHTALLALQRAEYQGSHYNALDSNPNASNLLCQFGGANAYSNSVINTSLLPRGRF